MEITSDNYFEKEAEIISDIQKCDFISFDLEMTGIAVGSRHFLDYPSERYLKHKISAEKFRIIQFGLVTWFRKADPNDKNKIIYEAKPYNIYVFPGKEVEYMNINCEVSALVFNSKHGMNFNTWIYKGVNYLNSKQYANLVLRAKDRNFNTASSFDKSRNIHKFEDIQTYDAFEKKFSEFIKDEKSKEFVYRKLPSFMVFHLLSKLTNEIRNQIYIEIEKNEENPSEDKLVIKKVTIEERQKLIEEYNQQKFKTLEKAKGVKNIWDEIIKNKKILVGHNLSIDILFCFSHFGEALPDNYENFKKLVNTSFNGLYDTKYLYNSLSSKEDTKYDSSLEVIYEKLSEKFKDSVNISIPTGFTNYLEKMKNNNKSEMEYHQADFDAFITGLAFCYLVNNYIDNNKDKDKLLEFYNYKIFFMKTFYKCFDLKNAEEFIESKTIPYCLRSLTKTCDFDLEKIINDKELYSLIKEKTFIENTNAMLILIDLDGNFPALEAKLMEYNQKLFFVYSLEEFKKILKEEEMQRKDKYKKSL